MWIWFLTLIWVSKKKSKCLEECEVPEFQGDGYCDDENNMGACDWDGGDCCNNSIPDYDVFCSVCRCLDPFEVPFSSSVVSTYPQEQQRGKQIFPHLKCNCSHSRSKEF